MYYFGVGLFIKFVDMFLYVGPGLGGSIIAILTGVIITFFSLLVAIFWIPLKKIFRFFMKLIRRK